MRKEKVLFLCEINRSFIEIDYRILSEKYDVKKLIINFKSIKHFLNLLKAIFYIFKHSIIFIWFASPIFLPIIIISKLSRKKRIVIAGGYDAAYAKYKKYIYGVRNHIFLKYFVSMIFNNSTAVFPLSNYTKKEVLSFSKPKNIETIYLGIDIEKFNKIKGIEKENIVITVASDIGRQYYKKGLGIFVEIARKMPNVKFLLIGRCDINHKLVKKILENKPNNLILIDFVKQEDLIKLYSKAKVYAQLSLHESFGRSLAEAMLCECIPVIANTSALPEVVGNVGYYVKYNNIEDSIIMISKALNSPKEYQKYVRERIIKNFSLLKRKQKLLRAINNL
ncbi:MAG: glycosyltransferase [Promethearchaeota archaeon]